MLGSLSFFSSLTHFSLSQHRVQPRALYGTARCQTVAFFLSPCAHTPAQTSHNSIIPCSSTHSSRDRVYFARPQPPRSFSLRSRHAFYRNTAHRCNCQRQVVPHRATIKGYKALLKFWNHKKCLSCTLLRCFLPFSKQCKPWRVLRWQRREPRTFTFLS